MEENIARRKRINRLKKMILGMVAMAILIPVIICIFLGVKVNVLSKEIRQLQKQLEEARLLSQEQEVGVFTTAHVEESPRETVSGQISEIEDEKTFADDVTAQKKVYLTFDDGPSTSTEAILDILKEYDVKATFFVVGKTDERSVAAYRRIVEEGHTLAMHSYSHKYQEIYASKESFVTDLEQLQEYLYEITGVWPRFYRFPGGSSNTVSRVDMKELIVCLNERDITYFDWNIASGDAVSGQLPKDTIVRNCLAHLDSQDECMVLMHDASDKRTTVEALPEIIAAVRMRGDACFLPITDETLPVQHLMVE